MPHIFTKKTVCTLLEKQKLSGIIILSGQGCLPKPANGVLRVALILIWPDIRPIILPDSGYPANL